VHGIQALVARFQRDASIPICLLTSQVGGLGLTLTAASRVILADPAWNPGLLPVQHLLASPLQVVPGLPQ
jgi:hypothetical protein